MAQSVVGIVFGWGGLVRWFDDGLLADPVAAAGVEEGAGQDRAHIWTKAL
jgi:hypothetical protein